ncbi:MAG: DUF1152 domain-containing protein [Ignisphaera sp.]|nr:DUF1152 domain-containing protein [Ignisphaera sp.]MCX8168122.1 DUF1152 domain-containing protein [Ignisphaera sp.]MDW8085443.1 DUF1152 domain-containing protein [Ignisphaera sp.]
MRELCLSIPNSRRALFLAIGGGGDIILTTVLALSYERCGGIAFIGGIVWERYVVDPIPGPIPLSDFRNVDTEHHNYIAVNPESYAIRNGNIIIPQIVRVSKVINRRMYVFDIHSGPKTLADALRHFINLEKIDYVVGVDVGGDSIATGFEESLWSPLADAISVAALAHINNAYLALASPGADGELDVEYILARISRLARFNGLIGGYVLGHKDAELLETLVRDSVSEASRAALKAFKGEYGVLDIRSGSRKANISPLSLVVFILDATIVARDSVARFIYDASSIAEARSILNAMNIYTELDLEEDLYEEILNGKRIDEINLYDIRKKGRQRLALRHFIDGPKIT